MIPRGPIRTPAIPSHLPKWHRCSDCDVHWRGEEEECWSCGRICPGTHMGAPRLNSQGGTASAMPEHTWAAIRQEIGVD